LNSSLDIVYSHSELLELRQPISILQDLMQFFSSFFEQGYLCRLIILLFFFIITLFVCRSNKKLYGKFSLIDLAGICVIPGWKKKISTMQVPHT